MEYLFNSQISLLPDGEIFTGDDAHGYVESGILHINDSQYNYTYKDNMWYENDFPCGDCRVPALQINNLKIVNKTAFESILDVPHKEE